MRRALILLLLALLAVTSAAQAQDGPTYRLREPGIEEFMAAIPGILEINPTDTYLAIAIYNQLTWHYPEFTETRFELLEGVAHALRNDYSQPMPIFGDGRRQGDWNSWLIEAWLRENPTALDSVSELQIGDFDMMITRADLSGDGLDELLLEIREIEDTYYGEFVNYLGYWILQSNAEGYRRILSPLGWYKDSWYCGQGNCGIVHTLFIDDINEDGLPEWVVLKGSYMLRGFGECRRVNILSWRNDTLVNLVDGDLSYCTLNESMLADVSPDASYYFTEMTFSQVHDRQDSWGCHWQETTTFTWNGTNYVLDSVEEVFGATFNCALRFAEEAMRAGDYRSAIGHYEAGLSLSDGPRDEEYPFQFAGSDQEHRQYARLRLAIAYALTDQLPAATQLIEDLLTESPASRFIQQVVEPLDGIETPLGICGAVFDAITELLEEPRIGGHWYDYSTMYVSARFDDVIVDIENYPPNPSSAGCPLEDLINEILSGNRIGAQTNPLDMLETWGLEIDDYRQADLNADGQGDWIINLIWDVSPVVLLSDGEHYEILREEPANNEGQSSETEVAGEVSSPNSSEFRCGPLGTWFCAFYETDHVRALEIIDALTAGDAIQVEDIGDFWSAVSYRRALALEALNRPDDALAEYVALYETAPESAWGRLAALHLEVVEE